jgi:hypothetical protein
MLRDLEPRTVDDERPSPSRGSRGASEPDDTRGTANPREALMQDLKLPRGPRREQVRIREHEYELRGSETRTLAAAGTFRVVAAADLRHHYGDVRSQEKDIAHLRRSGLINTTPYVMGRARTTLVTLTDRGRDMLEEARRGRDEEARQVFYAGISKPRELAHDIRLYAAYEKAVERLAARGDRIRRVVLEEELKREYQRFLQAPNRERRSASGRPARDSDEIERWARERQLPYIDGHVEFPDVRIEYDDRDGRRGVEDVEVTTPHYRGAHAAAKARAGFTCFRSVGARVGGGRIGSGGRSRGHGRRPFDPRVAEELLQ